ncbi:SGNH/GDSL hydrolase family protein [Wenxinia marina]|uniref:Lysophospholipase L1 n=1 Tax=Wenxinia marina DSM 24838 TaxID=1123501 RepID=A0A0D0QJE1_9RHOB|nr:SGNH/GDSL hydrolase family protein [Wenxinia marina]KIQ71143.1 Lysophospholipase L1 [Wenxinia marina DSM 24838]GGL54508.1 hydrolase [Wenxinia marina]
MTLLLTFGDSNTHGAPPMTSRTDRAPRLGPGVRWPTVAAARLGWDLVEEGLPGRTTQWPDPVMGDEMDGRPGLKIALRSHGPIDWLTIMLGTNDMKTRFDPTPARAAAGLSALLDIAQSVEWQDRHGGFRVLVIAPPPVIETGPLIWEFTGARAPSLGLAEAYRGIAEARGCGFLDAGSVIESSDVDGIHFGADAHAALGEAVAESLRGLGG